MKPLDIRAHGELLHRLVADYPTHAIHLETTRINCRGGTRCTIKISVSPRPHPSAQGGAEAVPKRPQQAGSDASQRRGHHPQARPQGRDAAPHSLPSDCPSPDASLPAHEAMSREAPRRRDTPSRQRRAERRAAQFATPAPHASPEHSPAHALEQTVSQPIHPSSVACAEAGGGGGRLAIWTAASDFAPGEKRPREADYDDGGADAPCATPDFARALEQTVSQPIHPSSDACAEAGGALGDDGGRSPF